MGESNGHERGDREPRRIKTHAYTPLCPVHGVRMLVTTTDEFLSRFRCPIKGCDRRDKAARIEFVPLQPQPPQL